MGIIIKTITDRNIFQNYVTIGGKITCDYKCDSQCKRTLNNKNISYPAPFVCYQ